MIGKAARLLEIGRRAAAETDFGFVLGHHYLSDHQTAELEKLASEDGGRETVREFEAAFARLVGPGRGAAFAAGRMAFFHLLQALGVGPGDEVLLPGFTCSVMANAVLRTGAEPVFANVDPDVFGSGPEGISDALSDRTRVVVAQHSFGVPCRVDEIRELVDPRGIFLVEDSALSLDSTLDGRKVGTFGRAALFSFDHSKPLNLMTGGFLYTEDEELFGLIEETAGALPELGRERRLGLMAALKRERLWNFPGRYAKGVLKERLARLKPGGGSTAPDGFLTDDCGSPGAAPISYPYPAGLPPFLARLGLLELDRWPAEKLRRRNLLKKYLEIWTEAGREIPTVYRDPRRDVVPLRFAFSDPQAGRWRQAMRRRLDVGWIWFREPIVNSAAGLLELGYRDGACPVSERLGREIVNWPIVVPPEFEDRLLDFFRRTLARIR